ncbi:unnamed protein product [Clavelina lepadiformis]|uniref:BTB domain-containing protein n=1 Tax=Clavelina lepadiformis TaxID=159417 RepID=A0ABP0G048_CLALP
MASNSAKVEFGEKFCKKTYKNDHSSKILNDLNSDRKSNQEYCDFTINVGTHVFSVHKCVICMFSDFFKNMLRTEMKEKQENKVEVPGMSVDTMEIILSFIYTSEITITNYNVYDVLAAADYMQIPSIKDYCRNFLFDMVRVDNCLSIRTYAVGWNDKKLLKRTNEFIAENFNSICDKDDFKELDFQKITELLQLKNNTATEEEVFQALIGWIGYDDSNRLQYLSKILGFLNLSSMSQGFLKQVVATQPYVMNSLECSNQIVHALLAQTGLDKTSGPTAPPSGDQEQTLQGSGSQQQTQSAHSNQQPMFGMSSANSYQSLPSQFQGAVGNQNRTTQNRRILSSVKTGRVPPTQVRQARPQQRGQFQSSGPVRARRPSSRASVERKNQQETFRSSGVRRKLLIIGGLGCEKRVMKYHPKNSSTSGMPPLVYERHGAAASYLDEHVFVMGGSEKKVEKLNLNENCGWMELTSMNRSRQFFSATSLNDYVYVSGGVSSTFSQASGEQFHPGHGEWLDIVNMQSQRSSHSLVSGKGMLFACGGWSGRSRSPQILNSAESFDPRVGKWWNVTSMLTGRHAIAGVFLNNEIYAIGGVNSAGIALSTVERYDARMRTWNAIMSMHQPREGHSACVIAGKIYVIGGSTSQTIEVYDPTINQWNVTGMLDRPRNFSCVVPI